VRTGAPDPVEFRSEVAGVRHICGHDIHTTIGLALADGLGAIRERLAGSVMLIFQPAEESATGARAMLEDGAFSAVTPDAVFSFHTAPLEVGQIATASRTLMPGRDAVRVDVRGDGDLEALAGQVRDVVMGAATLTGAQAMTPARPEFVLAQGGRVARSGDGWNVTATFTTSSLEASAGARRTIEQGLAALSADGATYDLDYRERVIAGVTNTPVLVEAANATARDLLGENAVLMLETMTPVFSEDFGSFQEEVPGVMYFLGVSNAERGWVGMPHSPDYVADEEAIFVGARVMAAVFLDLYGNGLPTGG
jgi:amidohydrolase